MIGVSARILKDGATAPLMGLLSSTKDKRRLLRAAGQYMVDTEVPRIFRQGGPPGSAWPKPKMRKGRPLRDTGRLLASIAYRANASDVRIGTPLTYAPAQQKGATIVPTGGKKWLAIPLSPPLSESQRQTSRPKDFPGAFVLIHGPEGPGLYRKAKGQALASSIFSGGVSKRSRARKGAGGKGVERIFAFVKSVKLPPRPFLVWTRRAVGDIVKLWGAMLSPQKKGA